MNHRKAFTLIELLVVIAIIAILAAILFPVLAQARTAAKKTQGVSAMKQINLAMVMYATDYDDMYPRNDDCQLNSSLNTKFNNRTGDPSPLCSGPFPFRTNHYTWQKWVMPYVKNVEIFFHPTRDKAAQPWNNDGEIFGSYALNLGLTGALNTWNRSATAVGRDRQSFLGGMQGSVPNAAATMIITEFFTTDVAFVPTIYPSAQASASQQTHYPAATRETWQRLLFKDNCDRVGGGPFGTIENTPDPLTTINGGVIVGYVDGHVSWMPAGRFVALSPSRLEFAPSFPVACGWTSGAFNGGATINTNIDYPLWGFSN